MHVPFDAAKVNIKVKNLHKHQSSKYVLMYSPDGTNVYGARGREFEGIGSVKGVECCKIVFIGGHFLFTCSDTFAVGCIV